MSEEEAPVDTYYEEIQCLIEMKMWEVALPKAEAELDYKKRWAGTEEHIGLWTPTCHLAQIVHGLGRFEEAEKHFCKALDIAQRLMGIEHKATIMSCRFLCTCWTSMDKHEDAERILRRVVEFSTRLLGTDHEDTVGDIRSLAVCLCKQLKLEEGLPLLRRALELSIRVRGLRHDDTICILLCLVQAYTDANEPAKAGRAMNQAMALNGNVRAVVAMGGNLRDCLDAV